MTAGYSIDFDVSGDGKFVASGDHDGRLFFWDWKTAKVYNIVDGHDVVTMGVQWHPV